MLIIENKKLQPIPFNWVENGVTTPLRITQMTVADRIKMSELHGKIIKNKALTDDQRGSLFLTSRVMCSIKDEEGNYFFTKDTQETHDLLSGEVLFQLSAEVSSINPIQTDTIADAKK
jgi:hypothetical protein